MGSRVLLVEGPNDTTFYEAFCRESGVRRVDVKPPGSAGAKVESKTNAIHVLPMFLQQLDDASVQNLGLIVDADYPETHGLGHAGTMFQIRQKLIEHGFKPEKRHSSGGFLFEHPDGLAPVGVWVMPNNRNNGMLEDFVQASIRDKEQIDLHEHASRVVRGLTAPRFKPIHRAKAEVATWLAWQKMPGKRLESVVGDNLIDLSSAECTALAEWLRAVFPGR